MRSVAHALSTAPRQFARRRARRSQLDESVVVEHACDLDDLRAIVGDDDRERALPPTSARYEKISV
jgi:hypothetical protein